MTRRLTIETLRLAKSPESVTQQFSDWPFSFNWHAGIWSFSHISIGSLYFFTFDTPSAQAAEEISHNRVNTAHMTKSYRDIKIKTFEALKTEWTQHIIMMTHKKQTHKALTIKWSGRKESYETLTLRDTFWKNKFISKSYTTQIVPTIQLKGYCQIRSKKLTESLWGRGAVKNMPLLWIEKYNLTPMPMLTL